MSGIVGLLHRDQAPVDRRLLEQLADGLAGRGPDAQHVWSAGPVGLGHGLLRTSDDTGPERQPLRVGDVWLTADARLDGRDDLVRRLQARGRDVARGATDAELLLHAYHAWGEDCVDHLLGDFAFLVWDGARRQLFAARDHFGVKPLFYAELSGCLVLSNTLDVVRLHPAVSDELNDLAVADFLLFGFSQDISTTVFRDVRRLPPAHALTWRDGTLRLRRYWSLPTEEPDRRRRTADYVEGFRSHLQTAVEDRLRTDRVGMLMSGGLDSSSLAAVARDVLARRGGHFDLRAYTAVYDRVIPDEERHYSGLVARHLGIPIHYQAFDDYEAFERWDSPELRQSEPTAFPLHAANHDLFRAAADAGRVALSGEGGDAVFYPESFYFLNLLRQGRLVRFLRDFGWFYRLHGRRPPLHLRTLVRPRRVVRPAAADLPAWLQESLVRRLDLTARAEPSDKTPGDLHAERPEAYARLRANFWAPLFESYDPGVTRVPLEVRHPFFDLRLVSYLLKVPSGPWFFDKGLLRGAMRGLLPEPVRRRPKTGVRYDHVGEHLRRADLRPIDQFVAHPGLAHYVARERVPPLAGAPVAAGSSDVPLRPFILNHWLASAICPRLNPKRRIHDEQPEQPGYDREKTVSPAPAGTVR